MILIVLGGLIGALLLSLAVGLALTWTAMGTRATGARLARMRASPNYRDGKFRNPVPVQPFTFVSIWQTLRDYRGGQKRVPDQPPPIERRSRADFATPPATGLRVTWLGHSSAIIEIDGSTVLLDPVFSERLSPVTFAGPRRFYPSPIAIDDLPPIDVVVISHDHYDHLDRPSVLALAPRVGRFVTPLGVGAHLEYWGVPADRIVELDWWQETPAGHLRLVACPARHFSGRNVVGDRTLWASFAIVGPQHRVFFSGDTGPMPLFSQVGERHGPFDLSLIKIGAYGRGWPDIHVDPEQAIELQRQVRSNLLMPVHWGTVNLSYHAWTEPAERLLAAAAESGTAVVIPRPGQMFEPASPPPPVRWWPVVSWERAPAAAR